MKHKSIAFLSLILTAVVLSVCWTFSTEASATEATATASGDELFSGRDLSGSYDEEVSSITLNGTGASSDSDHVSISGSVITIQDAGTYLLTGTLENGSILVDADKEDKIQLVLSGVTVHADTFAAIYVKQADKVFVTLAEGTVNSLTNGGSFQQIDDSTVDAVIFSRDDLTLNGSGTLQIVSPAGHGIVGKDDVVITDGSYEIRAAGHGISAKDSLAIANGSFLIEAGQDGFHAENSDDTTLGNIYIEDGSFSIQVSDDALHANTYLQVDSGSFAIAGSEGLEATYIQINGGTMNIYASDDGINAARKSTVCTPTVEINGGDITIVMGAGDTDGVDSNGDLIINSGTVSVSGNSCFDCDGTAVYNGGTIIINGQQVDSIPVQMMGGRGGMMGGMPGERGGKRN